MKPDKPRNIWRPILFTAVLALALAGCSQVSSLLSIETLPPTITQFELPTQTTAPPTRTSSPTVTIPPTLTVEPSQTVPATTRPTWTPIPSNTHRPTWTPTMTFTPLPTAELGVVIREDFSEKEGWKETDGENFKIGFGRGDYHMLVEAPYVEITSTKSHFKFAETRIEADIRYFQGEGYYGFSCRESSSAYYILFITNDGQYGVGERRADGLTFFTLMPSDVIETGKNSKNHVVAECRGNYLSLTVNDIRLVTHRVEGIGPGWVSMMIGTRESDMLEIFYDNLVVWAPLIE